MQGDAGATIDGEDRLDVLRRRLYRPGADEHDVGRFTAERDRRTLEDPAPSPSPARPRHRARAAALAGAAVAAAAVLLLAVQPVAGSPAPAATADAAGLRDVGEGRVLAVDRDSTPSSSAVPATVNGRAVIGQRFQGRGNAVVAFDAPSTSAKGGRAQVALTSPGGARVGWRALLRVDRSDWSSYAVVMARGTADEASPTVFVYAERPPTFVAVAAPAGTAWTLEVATTSGLGLPGG